MGDEANAALRGLVREYEAPPRHGEAMRRSIGTYLTNVPGIFGAASAYRSAKHLGHSVTVAEKHCAGLGRGIPSTLETLEAAIGIESQAQKSDTLPKLASLGTAPVGWRRKQSATPQKPKAPRISPAEL